MGDALNATRVMMLHIAKIKKRQSRFFIFVLTSCQPTRLPQTMY